MLYGYAINTLRKNPFLKRVIGFAMEPPAEFTGRNGSSEDLIYLEVTKWDDDWIAEAERFRNQYDIMQDDRIKEYRVKTEEYPDLTDFKISGAYKNPIPYNYQQNAQGDGLTRQQRRAAERRASKINRRVLLTQEK